MRRIGFSSLICAALFAAPLTIHAETADFTVLANGTAVTTQYPGVVFSLQGGPDSSGPPTTNDYTEEALANSTNPDYPTANILDMAFTSPVSGVSFTFDNYGDNGTTYFVAYDGATVVDTENISTINDFSVINVTGSDITDLQINNGDDAGTSWYFGVGELTFTPGATVTPEPGSFVLLGSGLLGVAGIVRRRFLASK